MIGRKLFIKLGCIFLVFMMVFVVGCRRDDSVTPPVVDPPATDDPVMGGTLRMIQASGPTVMSWSPEFGVADYSFAMFAAEPLLAVASDRTLEGVLAESWDEDPEGLKITFNLRRGVKFTDGSDFNADVVLWSSEIAEKYARVPQDDPDVASVEKLDDYTVVFNLNRWSNQLLENIGIGLMFSKAAFEKAGGEENGGIEWARANLVGTGPFKLKEWNRDNNMIWEKNEDYWGEGPYLDAIEIKFIPEATTAAAMMEAGEADMWSGAPAENMVELEKLGFVRQYGWAGIQTILVPNTINENTPLANLKVREAIEYAIDKQGIVNALGYGYLETLNTVAPKGDWGGDKEFRNFDQARAKALLAEAGYPAGFEVTLTAGAGSGGRNEIAEVLAAQLKEVGINVELDIADTGRFFGMMFGSGWEGLFLGFSGQDASYLTSISRWWGHDGTVYPSMLKSEKLLELSRTAMTKVTREEQAKISEEIVHLMAEEAKVIPLSNSKTSFIRTDKVHTDYLDQGMTRWRTNLIWLEK